ncbi:hypothetical protein [Micrococcus luteus]|uniref:hypothetical protein n=1 Tax=Micrococcus luteus TaxID=1270 RepID=UPI00201100FF|nr:hypothetical protein [Micrococcus luteus]
MLSLYIHGDSPLHRARAGLKTGLFAAWVLALTLLPLSLWAAGAAVVGAVTAYLVGFGLRRGAAMIASDLRALWLLFYVVLFAAQWIFTDAFAAGLMVARVLGLVLTAQVLTRTTRIADMTGVAEAVLRPVERIPWAGPRLARAGFRATAWAWRWAWCSPRSATCGRWPSRSGMRRPPAGCGWRRGPGRCRCWCSASSTRTTSGTPWPPAGSTELGSAEPGSAGTTGTTGTAGATGRLSTRC